jgi:chromate transport protein ChrA
MGSFMFSIFMNMVKMKKRGKRGRIVEEKEACELVCKGEVFCWIPRTLAVLFIIFISLFALDVFGDRDNLSDIILGLIVHLVPSIILVILLLVSWKCEKIGGALFIVAGIIFTIFFNTYKDIMTFLIISGPVFLIGILFWVSAVKKPKK